jgi:modulator of FtsH protease
LTPEGRRLVAYDASAWSDLFVATTGAAAALAGLLFVAVSINLERILQYPGLPERALETLLLLLGVVVASVFGLVPEPGRTAVGLELLVVGLVLVIVVGVVFAKSVRRVRGNANTPRLYLPGRILLVVPGTVPYVVGGASLLAEAGGGFYWVLAGIVGGLIGGVINAWVLLVEIQR